jgi:5'-deoxynucleotidase
MKENHFYAMLSRMKYINRWGLMRNTICENINEHSLDVAFIAHALGVIHNTYFEGEIPAERLAVMGMFHDATEIITGDMPTPVKYYSPVIRNAYKEVENVAMDELLCGLPQEMRDAYRPFLLEREEEQALWKYVKAADKLSAFIKCIEEKKMGNTDFDNAYNTIEAAVDKMADELPEVRFFVEKFLPAYRLTLDDSNA